MDAATVELSTGFNDHLSVDWSGQVPPAGHSQRPVSQANDLLWYIECVRLLSSLHSLFDDVHNPALAFSRCRFFYVLHGMWLTGHSLNEHVMLC